MEFKAGDKVSVLDTEGTFDIQVGDVGVVSDYQKEPRWIRVYFPKYGFCQNLDAYQVQPVSEVIKVDCHKPNVLKRIWNYLRGIK